MMATRMNGAGAGRMSRRAMFGERQAGDYDHLARFGEWDMSDPPSAFTLTAESTE